MPSPAGSAPPSPGWDGCAAGGRTRPRPPRAGGHPGGHARRRSAPRPPAATPSSPKNTPGPSVLRRPPSNTSSTSPSRTANMESPGAPRAKISSPCGQSRVTPNPVRNRSSLRVQESLGRGLRCLAHVPYHTVTGAWCRSPAAWPPEAAAVAAPGRGRHGHVARQGGGDRAAHRREELQEGDRDPAPEPAGRPGERLAAPAACGRAGDGWAEGPGPRHPLQAGRLLRPGGLPRQGDRRRQEDAAHRPDAHRPRREARRRAGRGLPAAASGGGDQASGAVTVRPPGRPAAFRRPPRLRLLRLHPLPRLTASHPPGSRPPPRASCRDPPGPRTRSW